MVLWKSDCQPVKSSLRQVWPVTRSTLSGVSTYAGFVRRNGTWEPFSLLINQPAPYGLRLEVADALATGGTLGALCRGRDC